jgi:hypothetical protein
MAYNGITKKLTEEMHTCGKTDIDRYVEECYFASVKLNISKNW